jgi:hypothetical protein
VVAGDSGSLSFGPGACPISTTLAMTMTRTHLGADLRQAPMRTTTAELEQPTQPGDGHAVFFVQLLHDLATRQLHLVQSVIVELIGQILQRNAWDSSNEDSVE